MKNIHVLPTNKPSRFFNTNTGEFHFKEHYVPDTIQTCKNHNIYITSSNEDINENDYIITKDGRLIQVSYLLSKDLEGASKVILTTDPSLAPDVQKIDDEFLEWFVKNPSCEEVEVKKGFRDGTSYGYNFLEYKIIIPTEEPKQERMYSEEELKIWLVHRDLYLYNYYTTYIKSGIPLESVEDFIKEHHEYLMDRKQFKKK